MPRSCEIVATLAVFETLRTLRPATRRSVEEFLRRLVRQPALPGDFEAPADDGRVHQVKMVGGWIVSHWADHAVREIRVTSIEPIE